MPEGIGYGLEERMKNLKAFEIEPTLKDKPMEPGAGCIERLMAAGKSREEAEAQCGAHKKNVEEMKRRDSLLGKIMSSVSKR